MTTVTKNQETEITKSASPSTEYPQLTSKFEWLYTLTAFWLVLGAHIDGWSHNNTPELESFFTPSHGVLYTGMFAVTGLMIYYAVQNYAKGFSLMNTLPKGYMGVLIGSFVFFLGGIGDGFWHTFLGIEVNVEALYSPTHLMLAIGAAMMLSGNLRRAWTNPDEFLGKSLQDKLPTFLSTAFFMSIITFFYQFAVPFHSITPMSEDVFGPEAGPIGSQGLGITGSIIYTVLLMGIVLKLHQKFGEDIPSPMFAIILPVNVLFATMMRFAIPGLSNLDYISTDGNYARILFLLVAIIVGYSIDLGLQFVNRSENKERNLTFFAVLIPLLLFSLYMLAIAITAGVGWSIHLAAGLPIVAGISGYLVRLLFI